MQEDERQEENVAAQEARRHWPEGWAESSVDKDGQITTMRSRSTVEDIEDDETETPAGLLARRKSFEAYIEEKFQAFTPDQKVDFAIKSDEGKKRREVFYPQVCIFRTKQRIKKGETLSTQSFNELLEEEMISNELRKEAESWRQSFYPSTYLATGSQKNVRETNPSTSG